MESENVWICGECDFNNNYDTDPDICNMCSDPNPKKAPKNAQSNPKPVQSNQPGSNLPVGTSVAPST